MAAKYFDLPEAGLYYTRLLRDIRKVATKYFDLGSYAIVVVGPEEEIQ